MEFKLLRKTPLQNTRLSVTPTKTRSIIPQEVLNYLAKSPVSQNTLNDSNYQSNRRTGAAGSVAPGQQGRMLSRNESNRGDIGQYELGEKMGKDNARRPLEQQNLNNEIQEANLDRSRQNWKIMKSQSDKQAKSVSKSPNKVGMKYTESDIENFIVTFHANKQRESRNKSVERTRSKGMLDNVVRHSGYESRKDEMEYVDLMRSGENKAQGRRDTSQDRSKSPNFRGLEVNKSPNSREKKQFYSETASSANKKNVAKAKESKQTETKNPKANVPVFKENLKELVFSGTSAQKGNTLNKSINIEKPEQKTNKKSMVDLSNAHTKNKTSMHALKYPDKSGLSSRTSTMDSRQRDTSNPSRASDQNEFSDPIKSSAYGSRNSTSSIKIGSMSDDAVDIHVLTKLLKAEFSRLGQNEGAIMDNINNNAVQSIINHVLAEQVSKHCDTKVSSVRSITEQITKQSDTKVSSVRSTEDEQGPSNYVAAKLTPEVPGTPSPYRDLPIPFPDCYCTLAHTKSQTSTLSRLEGVEEYLDKNKEVQEDEEKNCLIGESVSLGSERDRIKHSVSAGENIVENVDVEPNNEEVNHFEASEQEFTPRYGYQGPTMEHDNKPSAPVDIVTHVMKRKVIEPETNFKEGNLYNLPRQISQEVKKEYEPVVFSQQNFNSFGSQKTESGTAIEAKQGEAADVMADSFEESQLSKRDSVSEDYKSTGRGEGMQVMSSTNFESIVFRPGLVDKNETSMEIQDKANKENVEAQKVEIVEQGIVCEKSEVKVEHFEVKVIYKDDCRGRIVDGFCNQDKVLSELSQLNKQYI